MWHLQTHVGENCLVAWCEPTQFSFRICVKSTERELQCPGISLSIHGTYNITLSVVLV